MYFAQVRVFDDVEVQQLMPDAITGSGIASNYEQMVCKYLNDERVHWTHFLSIEDDMSFHPDCLHILARRELPIVGANYPTNKGSPLRFTSRGQAEQIVTDKDSEGVEPCWYLPQGFTLVAREVYEKLERPWYLTGYNPETNQGVTQDYYFCEQARKAGFSIHVDHDVSKRVGHIGPRVHTWQDVPTDKELFDGE
jgi:hypothetical protein